MGPSAVHSYIGDFVRDGGYVDVTMAKLEELLFGESTLSRCEVFGVVAGTVEAIELLTLHRGLALRAVGSFKARVADPLKKPDYFVCNS